MDTEKAPSGADEFDVPSPRHSAPPSRDVPIRFFNQSRDGSLHEFPETRDDIPKTSSSRMTSSPRHSASDKLGLTRRSQTFVTFPLSSSDRQRTRSGERDRDVSGTGNRKSDSGLSKGRQSTSGSPPLRSYDFTSKASFDASQHLLKSRSDTSLMPSKQPDSDIWKRLAPDFRPQIYAPKPPKRNSRDAVRPWSYTGHPEDYVRVTANDYNDEEDTEEGENEENCDPFMARIRLPDTWDGKLEYVRQGTYHPGAYKTPKPHDFRGYPPIATLGLPEFITASDRDPSNIHFLSNNLNKIHGLSVKSSLNRGRGRQMYENLRQPPNWEARLILPHNPFPNRYAAYTRYRIPHRNPHSALMERIGDTLSAQWAREKMERALHSKS